MATIKIEWLTDEGPYCETCGPSYAEGARVRINGMLAVELKPVAHCFADRNYNERTVYDAILMKLGHTVEHA